MKKILFFVMVLFGLGAYSPFSDIKVYAQEVQASQEFNSDEVWKNRIEDNANGNYVVFASWIGEGEERQVDLFIGEYEDNKISDIKRLTNTKEFEFQPLFLNNLSIVFGRSNKYPDFNTTSLDKVVAKPNRFFTIGTDGTGERETANNIWLNQYLKTLN